MNLISQHDSHFFSSNQGISSRWFPVSLSKQYDSDLKKTGACIPLVTWTKLQCNDMCRLYLLRAVLQSPLSRLSHIKSDVDDIFLHSCYACGKIESLGSEMKGLIERNRLRQRQTWMSIKPTKERPRNQWHNPRRHPEDDLSGDPSDFALKWDTRCIFPLWHNSCLHKAVSARGRWEKR